jgi:hypothetical protein
MISQKTRTAAIDFDSFIQSNEICVIYACSISGIEFNRYLRRQLLITYRYRVSIGTIGLNHINYSNPAMKRFVEVTIPNLGLPKARNIYPGYYLFQKGNLVGFHPGTVDVSAMQNDKEKLVTLFNLLYSIRRGIKHNNILKGVDTFLDGAWAQTGYKVFAFFQHTLNHSKFNSSRLSQHLIFRNTLAKAYVLLGVNPNATDEEIHKRWRKLMVESHPDKDSANSEERTKLTSEINAAYEIIKDYRANNKKD